MKFGKLPTIDQVDFSLPAEPAGNQLAFEAMNKAPSLRYIYIGGTGWSTKEWVGSVYPKGTKAKDFLLHYGKQFNTIELNTTHYRIPTIDTVNKWVDTVPDDFKFCPKIPQSISHSRDFGLSRGQVELFSESVMKMGDKMGCCFLQLPPYFGLDRIKALEVFLNHFPQELALAVECRHETWFESNETVEQLLSLLRSTKKVSLITDVAGRRDVAHMGVSSDKVLIRFVGNGLHPTDYQRIDEWILRIKAWFSMGLKEVYFFTHEPDNILAPQLAAYLCQQLKSTFSVEVRGPQLLDGNEGEQMSLF